MDQELLDDLSFFSGSNAAVATPAGPEQDDDIAFFQNYQPLQSSGWGSDDELDELVDTPAPVGPAGGFSLSNGYSTKSPEEMTPEEIATFQEGWLKRMEGFGQAREEETQALKQEYQPRTGGQRLATELNRVKQERPQYDSHGHAAPGSRLDYIGERLPFAGGFYSAEKALKAKAIADKIGNGEQVYQDDINYLALYVNALDEHGKRTFMQQIGDTVSALPAFGIEMLATAGSGTIAKEGLKAGAKKLLGESVERGVTKAATNAAASAVGVASQAALMPGRVATNAAQRSMPEMQQQADADGNLVNIEISDDTKSFAAALPAGFLDTAIEIGSEKAGQLIAPALGKIGSKLPWAHRAEVLKKAVVDHFLSKPGNTSQALNKLVQEAGWNGPVSEYLEERAGDAARLATGLESPDENVLGQLGLGTVAAAHGDTETAGKMFGKAGRQSAVEAASFAAVGGALGAANVLLDDSEGDAPVVRPTSTPPAPKSVLRRTPPQTMEPDGSLDQGGRQPGQALINQSQSAQAGMEVGKKRIGKQPPPQPVQAPPAADVLPEQQESVPTQPGDVQPATPTSPEQLPDSEQAARAQAIDLSAIPEGRLDRETEAAVARAARAGNRDAANLLAARNQGLVEQAVRSYAPHSANLEDLLSAGNEGLFNAISNYDPDKEFLNPKTGKVGKTKFSTYAVPTIRSAIDTHLKKENRRPEVNVTDTEGDSVRIEKAVISPPEQELVQSEESEELSRQKEMMRSFLPKLPKKERVAIEGYLAGKTMEQIAAEQGVTKQRIQQEDKLARRRLKKLFRGEETIMPKSADAGFSGSATNKAKGAVKIKVGDDLGAFIKSVKRLQEKIPSMDEGAAKRQVKIIDEHLQNSELPKEQLDTLSVVRKMMFDRWKSLQQPEQPVEPAKPAKKELTPEEQVSFEVQRGVASLQRQYVDENGKPVPVSFAEPADQSDADAVEYAKARKLNAMFFKAAGQQPKMRAGTSGSVLFLQAGRGGNLWEVVGHEVAQNKNAGLPESALKKREAEMLAPESGLSKDYHENLDADRGSRRREAAAMMVRDILADKSQRDTILSQPKVYAKFIAAVNAAIGDFNPQDKATAAVVNAFRRAGGLEAGPSYTTGPAKKAETGSIGDFLKKKVGDKQQPEPPPEGPEDPLRVAEIDEEGPPINLDTVHRIFPGRTVEKTKRGYRVDLNGGPLDIISVDYIPVSEQGWNTLESELGRKLTDAEKEKLGAAGKFGMMLPDGTMHTGLGVISLTAGLANDVTARHEALHFFRRSGMLSAAEWKALSEKYGKPGLSDAAIEEAVARAAESYQDNRSLWEKIRDWLLSIPAALGITNPNADAVLRLMSSSDFLDRRASTPLSRADRFAIAWHGTPHTVDRFSTSKIGTGEGAQVYGWGLYFASLRQIAEHYRKALSSRKGSDKVQFTLDGQEIEFGNMPDTIGKDGALAISYVDLNKDRKNPVQEALGQMRSQMDVAKHRNDRNKKTLAEQRDVQSSDWVQAKSEIIESDDIRIEQTQRAIKWLEDRMDRVKVKQPGNLYKVEIKPQDDEFLDLDKALSEQSAKVKAAIQSVTKDAGIKKHVMALDWQPGRDVYDFLAEMPSGKKEQLQWKTRVSDLEGYAELISPHYSRGTSFHHRQSAAGPGFVVRPRGNGKFIVLVDGLSPSAAGATAIAEGDALGNAAWEDAEYDSPEEAKQAAQEMMDDLFPNGLMMGPEAASKLLLEHGIRGNKYLDASSRKIGDGSHNYVVFDDQDVSILDRFAIRKVPPHLELKGAAQAEQQFAESEQSTKETFTAAAKRIGAKIGRSLYRTNLHVPSNLESPAHASMNELLRLGKEHGNIAKEDAQNVLASIVRPLKKDFEKYALFTRKIILDNLYFAMQQGQPARFGYDLDQNGNQLPDRADWIRQVKVDKDRFDALAAQDPDVQKALDTYKGLHRLLVKELQQEGLLGKLSDEQVDNYYHQQVLDYLSLNKRIGANPKLTKAGFAKERVKGDHSLPNYNTAFEEAEFEFLNDAFMVLQKQKWLKDLDKRFGILPQLRAQAKANGTTWKEELRKYSDTHAEWNGAAGLNMYKGIGIKEKVVRDVLAGLAQVANVSKDDLADVLIVGGKKRPMVLPKELVEQLQSMEWSKPSDKQALAEAAAEISRAVLNTAKATYMMGPQAIVPAQLRNLTGDFDKAIGAGTAAAIPYLKQARDAMHSYYYEQSLADPNVRKARDLGVMGSSFAEADIDDMRHPAVKWLRKNQNSIFNPLTLPSKALDYYIEHAKRFSAYRESILRYAVFQYYQDALSNGTLAHYGASNKETVDRLRAEMGVDVAAAHMARNQLGDYGNLTVMGDFLRRQVLPFHAWTEITLKSYPQIISNAMQYGKRKVGKNGLAAAGLSAAALAQIALPLALMSLWNNLFWPDEEDQLSDNERKGPHIITGKNEDGSVRLLRNAGAFGDFLEQFGLLSAISRLDNYRAGQMSAGEVASEAGWQIVARWANSVRPEVKATIEQFKGSPMYPDPWGGSKRPRDEMLAANTGFGDTYRAAKGVLGKVTGNGIGTRARPHAITKAFIGVSEPRKQALYEIMELRDRFLDKLGEQKPPQDQRAANMRFAAENNNQTAFEEARKAWLTTGAEDSRGNYEKFQDRLDYLDPLARLNQSNGQEERFIREDLTADQRIKLRIATEAAAETREKMVLMWNEAEKKDPPEIREAIQAQKQHWLLSKIENSLLTNRPESLTSGEAAEGQTLERKQARWDERFDKAVHSIITSGLGRDQIEGFLQDRYDEEVSELGSKAKNTKELKAALKRGQKGRDEKMEQFRAILDYHWKN